MQRFFVFVICAAVLLCAGGLTSISHQSHTDSTVKQSPAEARISNAAPCEELGSPPAAATFPVKPFSHHEVDADGSLFPEFLKTAAADLPAPQSEIQTAAATSPASPLERQRLVELIQRMFPGADDKAVQLWADVYEGTDLGEAEFLLEQKRRLSGSLDLDLSGGGVMQNSEFSFSVAEADPSEKSAEQLIQNNLRCFRTIGYRSHIVLPEAASDARVNLSPAPPSNPFVTFRSFEQGSLIQSPVPTHVAAETTDGSVMFHLEGDLVTRRGDFQRLPDGRVGLITSHGMFALRDSPAISSDIENLRILADGQIVNADDSAASPLGQIQIVRVPDLHRLTSTDGVIFHYDVSHPGSMLEVVPSAEVSLRTNCLELSNVKHDEDNRLLNQLRSTTAVPTN
jgi:flagellar basal body rod protein FlgG